MAKLHPVKNGPRPNNTFPHTEIDHELLEGIAGSFNLKYIGQDPPEFNIASPSEYAEHAVLEVSVGENKKLTSGFYLVEGIHPRDIGDAILALQV